MSEKYRVLLVHNYYQIPGGEDTVVANEKKMLENNGHIVFLYSKNNNEIKTFNVLKKMCFPFSTFFSIKTYNEVKKMIRENQIDIVHVHNTLSLVTPSVFYAADSCNVPVVQTLHNFRMQCPNGLFFRDGKTCEECMEKGFLRAIRHKCYRNSRLQTIISSLIIGVHRKIGTYRKINFICLTEFNKQKLLQLNNRVRKNSKKIVEEDKVFVKPNFAQKSENRIPYENRLLQCVFAGRLEEIKGIKQLLKAWKYVEDVKLLVCGTGPLEDWCRTYIKENHLNNVELLGHISHEKLMELMCVSKAVILPSLVYEGFPMTVAESFACGTPVIGSKLGNTGALITDGQNGWKIDVENCEDIVDKIHKLQSLRSVECTSGILEEENYYILLNIYKKALNGEKNEKNISFNDSI